MQVRPDHLAPVLLEHLAAFRVWQATWCSSHGLPWHESMKAWGSEAQLWYKKASLAVKGHTGKLGYGLLQALASTRSNIRHANVLRCHSKQNHSRQMITIKFQVRKFEAVSPLPNDDQLKTYSDSPWSSRPPQFLSSFNLPLTYMFLAKHPAPVTRTQLLHSSKIPVSVSSTCGDNEIL